MANMADIECRDSVDRLAGLSFVAPRGTSYRSLQTSRWEPDYFELAREGRLFICSAGVLANHVAAVEDIPTTASAYTLYNPATSGVVMAILSVWAQTSGTQGVGGSLLVANPQTRATAITANTTGVVVKNATGSQRAFPGFWATGITLDAAAAWMSVAGIEAAVLQGSIGPADLKGAIIVRPGYTWGTHYYTKTGTAPKAGIGCLVALLDAKMFD